MKEKFVVFLGLLIGILFFVVVCMFYQNKALKAEKNGLKKEIQNLTVEVKKRENAIKEMEKQNEILLEAKKENEEFKKELLDDSSDNLDVVPSAYILNKLHKD